MVSETHILKSVCIIILIVYIGFLSFTKLSTLIESHSMVSFTVNSMPNSVRYPRVPYLADG